MSNAIYWAVIAGGWALLLVSIARNPDDMHDARRIFAAVLFIALVAATTYGALR